MNVFHFTTNGDYGTYGYRVPALLLKEGKRVGFRIDGGPNRDHVMTPFVAGTKFHVRFERVYDSVASKYRRKAYLNRVLQFDEEIPDPVELQNVKVYTCDAWYDDCDGVFVLKGFKYGPLPDASAL